MSRVGFARWIAVGLVLRVLLSPIQHTWDSQTWWNVAGELGREPNFLAAVAAPYEHMRQLSALAQGAGFSSYYEFWAYPPGMLMLWWPIARAWFLLAGQLPEHFAGPDTFTAMPIPLLLSLGMKVPIIAADLVIALLLRKLSSNSSAAAKWYLLNPYVLLIGAWTFDPLMVALLLGGILAAKNERWALAGALLGLGAAIKFVPALLVPVVMLHAWRHAKSPIWSTAIAALSSVAVFVAICALWHDGVAYVFQFHAARVGGGMSWQSIWGALSWIDPFADLAGVHLFLSAQLGTLTLTGCLILTVWAAWLRGLDLLRMSLVVLLAYLAGSKLVNEAYPLAVLALALCILPSQSRLVRFLWIVPLAFAAVNVPAWGFALAPAETLGLIDLQTARLYHAGYVLTYQYLSVALAIIGTGFQVGCALAAWSVLRPIGRPELETALGTGH